MNGRLAFVPDTAPPPPPPRLYLDPDRLKAIRDGALTLKTIANRVSSATYTGSITESQMAQTQGDLITLAREALELHAVLQAEAKSRG